MTVGITLGGSEYALGPLTDSLGFLTRVVQVQISDRVRASGGMEISPATLSLLRLIKANPGIRQAHAARILVIQESNMANLTKEVMERGLVERRAEARRRGGLWITKEGEREIRKCTAAFSIDRSYAGVLTDTEYRQLVQLLNRVYRSSLG